MPIGVNDTRKAGIVAEFDEWAATYESGRLAPWYEMQAREAIARLDLTQARRVLDIGCGTGWALRQLARAHPDVEFTGVDLSPKMVEVAGELARREGLDNVRFQQCDWEDNPRLEGRFDAVLLLSVLHYFQTPTEALASIFELLYEGGQLVLVERSKRGSILTSIWGALHKYVIKDGVEFFDADEILRAMRAAGFPDARIYAERQQFLRHGKLFTSILIAGGKRERAD